MGLSRDNLRTIATRTGRRVVEAWSAHDAGQMGTVVGVVLHHTGSSQATAAVAPTLGIVRDGRSDLNNALCNFYIDKAGTIYLITEKIAWHAGAGSWRGVTDGNGHFLGIEPESDGVTWTAATLDAYVALVAEIVRFLGVDPDLWTPRHGQWAPGRKTDFSGLDEAAFRARVRARLAGTPTEDDMPLTAADADLVANTLLNKALARMGGPAGQTNLAVTLQWLDANLGGLANRLSALEAKAGTTATAAAQPVVDAGAVAAALAGNAEFLNALARAVNDDASRRLQS